MYFKGDAGMLNREEAILAIDYYNADVSSATIDRSKSNSDSKLIAIATDIINNRMGQEWYQYVLKLEERKRIQAKINMYDDTWINSPYYKYKHPRKQLPADYEIRVKELKTQLYRLNLFLEKRKQKAGRVSRKPAQKRKLYA